MKIDKFHKATEIWHEIKKFKQELNKWEREVSQNPFVRFTVESDKRTVEDPLGQQALFIYPSNEIAEAFRLECLKAVKEKINELETEFNKL